MALMENVLMEPPCGDGAQYNVRQLLALCTLGLVAGGGSKGALWASGCNALVHGRGVTDSIHAGALGHRVSPGVGRLAVALCLHKSAGEDCAP